MLPAYMTSEEITHHSTTNHRGIDIERITRTAWNRTSGKTTTRKMWRVREGVDGCTPLWDFDTRAQAAAHIDRELDAEAGKKHTDFRGNWWIIRPLAGRFTIVATDRHGNEAA